MLGAGDDTNRRGGGPQRSFDDECAGRAQGVLLKESRGHFSRRVDRALDDPSLQKALVGAMTGLRGRRDKAFESFDFEKGRADLKQRRVANLDRLPELLEQFTQRLAAVGGVVHLAKDAAEAREIIYDEAVRRHMARAREKAAHPRMASAAPGTKSVLV